jgi:hypothetical protein
MDGGVECFVCLFFIFNLRLTGALETRFQSRYVEGGGEVGWGSGEGDPIRHLESARAAF